MMVMVAAWHQAAMASGCDGNDEVLAKMMCGALEHDKNLQKIVIDACRLRE